MKGRKAGSAAVVIASAALLIVAGCGSNAKTPGTSSGNTPTSGQSSGAASVPSDLSVSSFDVTFS